jgi:hypothetical protein
VIGISVSFDDCEGSLNSGKLDFTKLRVEWRKNGLLVSQNLSCDLKFDRLSIDVGGSTADLIFRDTSTFLSNLKSLDDSKVVMCIILLSVFNVLV